MALVFGLLVCLVALVWALWPRGAFYYFDDSEAFWAGVGRTLCVTGSCVLIYLCSTSIAEDFERIQKQEYVSDSPFTVTVVRRVATDIKWNMVLGQAEQIKVKFLGVPINCLVSPRAQSEDGCAIYRALSGYSTGRNSLTSWLTDPVWLTHPMQVRYQYNEKTYMWDSVNK